MNEFIEIRRARENNLKDVTLRIPKRQITIFTGVSGSGKSSIVFDTLATEAQRQLYENFSLFIRSFLPKYPQPDADAIENLPMAVIVDQKRLGGGSHSTVGTVTDIHGVLRLEPTTGLHMSDVANLLAILDRLVDDGNSVVVIEHNMDIVRRADWIIDLGPEGGSKGGRVVFAGTPKELLAASQSLTSRYLQPAAPTGARRAAAGRS